MNSTTVDKQERRWLRVPEAARRLDVHEQTLYRWCREGRVPTVQLGGPGAPLRIPERALERWIIEHEGPAA
jgi:excisionase family DNA binding protein